MNFGGNYLLEPTDERDTRRKILKKLSDLSEGLEETDLLPKYPTMHILKDRGESADVRYDFMTEDDPSSWQQAFQNMAKALDVLDAHDVYYRIKFSGHRSLHLMIPAESFPRTFRGGSVNQQFDSIQKRIKNYLPDTGHATIGLRAVYSTHPKGAMVSIPLSRQELPSFRPWMANIHTVDVDFDWFQAPEDAVERNEKFLHTVFDNKHSEPVTVSAPSFQPLPVKAYAGDALVHETEILQAIDSEHPQERVTAARAALVQDMSLPQEKLKSLLSDTEPDAIWFGMEIALRDSSEPDVESFVHLLGQKDDYLIALGYQMLAMSSVQVDSVFDYLVSQREITQDTAVAIRLIADMDWPALVTFPTRIQAESLQEWFEKVWVICGTALCLRWKNRPEPIFEEAYRHVRTFEASPDECSDKVHQLELLLKLQNRQSRKRLRDELLFQPADELIQYGHDLRGIVMAMLGSPHAGTVHGAMRLLTRLWWDDCIDLLIQKLDSSSSPRKGALKALVDIGEPAVESLLHAIQTIRNQRIIFMSIEALGRIGDERAIPIIRERAGHPNDRIRFNARRVLKQYFSIEMRPGREDVSIPDASEVEETD